MFKETGTPHSLNSHLDTSSKNISTETNSFKQTSPYLPKIQSSFQKNFPDNKAPKNPTTHTTNRNKKPTSNSKPKSVHRSNSTSHKIVCKSKRKENSATNNNTFEFLFEVCI